MKTPSNDLYQLVKSLTKSEKRYFKLNASAHGGSKKYMAIFDAMESMDEYDETALKEQFKNEKWIKRFNSAKHYLNKALLDSLVKYNQSNEPQFKLADLILHARVLQGKGFYKRCKKLIDRGKKMAVELHDYSRLLELHELEGTNHPAGINLANRDEILDSQLDTLDKLESEYRYSHIYKFSFEIFAKSGYSGIHKGEENIRKSQILVNDPLFTDFSLAKTFHAQWQFINMNYINAAGNRDTEKMLYWIEKATALFDNKPKLKIQHHIKYVVTLLNLQDCQMKLRNFKDALETTHEVRGFYPRHLMKTHDRLTYFVDYGSTHQLIQILVGMGDFERAFEILPDFKELQKTYKMEISEDIYMQQTYMEAEIHFGVNQFDECNRVLDMVIRSGAASRLDLQKKARVLLLASHYESGKIDLVDYGIRSTYRLFQRNNQLTEYDKFIFKLMESALDGFDNKEELLNELAKVNTFKNRDDSDVDYSEIIMWLNAKIHGISLAEMAQRESGMIS